jgi:hypothetical protein
MANPIIPSVSPQEIEEIIERASKEPGINDMLALLRLSQEITQGEQIKRDLTVQPFVAQVTGTAGWVR